MIINIQPTSDDALAKGIASAKFGDTVLMGDGIYKIIKETYGLEVPAGVTLAGNGVRTVIENYSVNGIKPGNDCMFRDFHIWNSDMNVNRQWCFRAVSEWSFQRAIFLRVVARGDTDCWQAGGERVCSGSIIDCDFEAKCDCFIASTLAPTPSLFVVEKSRFAAIGPSVQDPTFRAQCVNLAGNSQVIMRDSQIITTYKAIYTAPGTRLELINTPRTNPDGGKPLVEFDVREGQVQTLLVID